MAAIERKELTQSHTADAAPRDGADGARRTQLALVKSGAGASGAAQNGAGKGVAGRSGAASGALPPARPEPTPSRQAEEV
ncbi:MAG TPA: hypothetical protein VE713_07075, partial [Pyrinomonadaceae bacterium]|nr:hypothetical protein [Pyrinomonadaceae bacterium]